MSITQLTPETNADAFRPFDCEVCGCVHCDIEHPSLWDAATDDFRFELGPDPSESGSAMLGHGGDE